MKVRIWTLVIALALCLVTPTRARAEETTLPNGAEFAAALQLYYQQDWPHAADAFQKIVDKDPRDTMSWFYLLNTYMKRNDLRSILYELDKKVVATNNQDSLALAELGMGLIARYVNEKREPILDDAQKTLEKSLELDKNDSVAHTALGLVYFCQRSKMARAKGHFIEAVRLNPNDLMALERIGDITLVDEKRPQETIQLSERIIAKAPTYPDGYWYVGSSYYDMGDWDKCIEYMRKVIELDPHGVTQGNHAPILMGKAFLKKRDFPSAREAFTLALKLEPNSLEAHALLEQASNPPRSPDVTPPDKNKNKRDKPGKKKPEGDHRP